MPPACSNRRCSGPRVGALAQSYDYLVLDAGAQSEIALASVAATAPYAVLVGGDTPANALDGARRPAAIGGLRRGHGPDRSAAGARRGRRAIGGMTRGERGRLQVQGFSRGAEHALLQRRVPGAAAADGRRRRDPDAASRAAAAARPVPAEPSARGDAAVLRARDPAAAPLQGRSDLARRDAPAADHRRLSAPPLRLRHLRRRLSRQPANSPIRC